MCQIYTFLAAGFTCQSSWSSLQAAACHDWPFTTDCSVQHASQYSIHSCHSQQVQDTDDVR